MDFETAGDALLSSEEGGGRPGSAGDARILAFRSKVRGRVEGGGGGGGGGARAGGGQEVGTPGGAPKKKKRPGGGGGGGGGRGGGGGGGVSRARVCQEEGTPVAASETK